MGRRKVTKSSGISGKKSAVSKSSAKNEFKSDVLGGFLVVLGLLFFVFLTFNNLGIIASSISSIFKGMFGKISLLFPVVLIFVGIYSIVSDKKVKVSKEIEKGLVVMIIVAAVFYAFCSINFDMFKNAVNFLVTAYNQGVIGTNVGGFLGALIAATLVQLTGTFASKIILIFVML
jgi:S-DNA-T family DNA segregation ATPase FtsK/SpoIIIE